jgi:hypothetical protein
MYVVNIKNGIRYLSVFFVGVRLFLYGDKKRATMVIVTPVRVINDKYIRGA